jgi:hypothetical protein
VITRTAARNAMGPGRLRMTTRGQRLFGNQTVATKLPSGADDARTRGTRWAIMTVTPFDVLAGLVILGVLIVIVLAAKRWDD